MKVDFVLNGRMPLLMHADSVEEADALDVWRKSPENKNISKAGDDRSPAWTWQAYLYHDGKNIVFPSDNLMVCLRAAGAQIIMKKQKTFKEISQSGMLMETEFLPFLVAGKQLSMQQILTMRDWTFDRQAGQVREELGFRLWIKRAKVGQSKHIRVRPRFDQWSITGSVNVSAPEITFEVLEKMFELAGRVGLGDWRPGCKTPGPFGMFAAELTLAG